MAGVRDVVVPVRVAQRSEELRYALRSWAVNLPHRRVWLVGHRPPWAGDVGHIPTVQGPDRWVNTTIAMRAACEHPDVSNPFVWANDDFYLMRPVDTVPVLHRGRLRDVAERRAARAGREAYGDGLRAAVEHLTVLGYDEPLCYELHAPLPVVKAAMLQALEAGAGLHVAKRSVYGNLAQLGGTLTDDVKIAHRRPQGYGPDTVFLSTMPDAFANGHVGRHIRGRFPGPCRYEKRGR